MTKRIQTLIAAVLTGPLFACAGPASDYSVVVHTVSKHAKERPSNKRPYNEFNYGVAIRKEITPTIAVQGGVYKNSFHKTSGYIIADWTPIKRHISGCWYWHAGTFIGAVSGYPYLKDTTPVIPAAGFQGGLSCKKWTIQLRGGPTPRNAVISLELRKTF